MSNLGKFKDRNPGVRPAGIITNMYGCDIRPLLNYVTTEEELDAAIKQFPKPPPPKLPVKPKDKAIYMGYYTKTKELMSPTPKRFFRHLLEELKETAYKSYWNNELGKVPDQIPGLPTGMDPETTLFGAPTKSSSEDTLANVVFPPRSFGEIQLEEELGHSVYHTSHKSCRPGKPLDRMYDAPRNVVYGKKDMVDRTGILLKTSLHWHESASSISGRQAEFFEKHKPKLGKSLSPNNILKQVGLDFTFGGASHRDATGVKEAMKFGPINRERDLMAIFISYINQIREQIKKRDPPFPHMEFVANLILADDGNCGCLPLSVVYNVCGEFGLQFNKEDMEPILSRTGILHGENDDIVDYKAFASLLDPSKPLPYIGKINDLQDEWKFYESTYQTFTNDLNKKPEYVGRRLAGVPKLRVDRWLPDGTSVRDLPYLIDETSVDACIRPSLFSHYGLNHRDFFRPRTKEYMKDLWKRVGLEIPDAIFEEMWKEGLRREENIDGMVCVESFRNMLDEMSAVKLAEMRDTKS